MKKLRNCPFCGKKVDSGFPTLFYNPLTGKWVLSHWCNEAAPTSDVYITVYGKTEQDAIDKWNGERRGTDSSTPLRSAQNDTGGVTDEQEHPTD